CLGLGEAALAAAAPGTYGTVHETLTHLVDAHGDYVRRLTGEENDPFLEGAADPDVLREYLERARAGWRAYLDGGRDEERPLPVPDADVWAYGTTPGAPPATRR